VLGLEPGVTVCVHEVSHRQMYPRHGCADILGTGRPEAGCPTGFSYVLGKKQLNIIGFDNMAMACLTLYQTVAFDDWAFQVALSQSV